MPSEQFLQQIEISRTFLRAKQVGEKRGRFKFVVEMALNSQGSCSYFDFPLIVSIEKTIFNLSNDFHPF